MSDGLFDAAPLVVTRPQPERLSADRRRTFRQTQAIANGGHPLGLVFPWVRALPDADRTASAGDAKNLPRRCGSCRLREVFRHHDNSHPKCTADDGARMTHSAATDVRAWWPACASYEPGDPALSPDAARHIP